LDQFLSRLARKLLNLLKAFQNQRHWPWPAFKSGGHCAASFSKQIFSSETYLPDFLKLARLTHGEAQKYLLSNRSKGFEVARFQKLCAKLTNFDVKWPRTY
jgi:hypothetical protein